jgi:hypothetical protein
MMRRLPPTARDSLFLAVVVALSSAPFTARLGFYSDDWALLALMNGSSLQSVFGLFHSLYSPWTAMRPGQLLYSAVLYRLFGLDPLGYHLVNLLVLMCMACFLYLALHAVRVPRAIAVAIALVYSVLPHYSSDRLWFAAFNITLSMTLCFVGLYASSRVLRAGSPARALLWLLSVILAFVAGALSYEVPLPLYILNGFLIWRAVPLRAENDPTVHAIRHRAWAVTLVTCASTAVVVIFKLMTTVRLGWDDTGALRTVVNIIVDAFRLGMPRHHAGLNIEHALRVNFVDFVSGLPAAVTVAIGRGDGFALLPALLVGIVAWRYLTSTSFLRDDERGGVKHVSPFALIASGVLIFWLGYGIFLTNSNIQFTLTGIGNRVNIAAAVGVAMIVVGIGSGLAKVAGSSRLRRLLFGSIVGAVSAACVVADLVVAGHWVRAYLQERKILAGINSRLPQLPAGSTLLLDGICPNDGPSIVFDSSWDLEGALRIIYRDRSLKADVITPRTALQAGGLATMQYGERYRYPFDDRLLIYNHERQVVSSLRDPEAARKYFGARRFDRVQGCPEGLEGLGAPAW